MKKNNLELTIAFFLFLGLTLIPLIFSLQVAAVYRLPKTLIFWLTGSLMSLFFFLEASVNKQLFLPKNWLTAFLGLFFLALFLTLPFSLRPLISLTGYLNLHLGLFTFMAALGFFLGGLRLAYSQNFSSFLNIFYKTLAFIVIGLSIFGWLQFLGLNYPTWYSTRFGSGRVGSLLGNPNYFAAFLALALPLLATYFWQTSKTEKLLFAFSLIWALGSFFLAKSAIFFLVVFSSSLLIIFFFVSSKRLKTFLLLALIIALLIAALFLLKTEKASLTSRIMLWQAGLKMIKTQPLTGYGLDTLRYVLPKFIKPPKHSLPMERFIHLHNMVLNQAVTSGVLSALAVAVFFLFLILQGLKLVLTKKDEQILVAGWVFALLNGFLILQFTPESPALMAYLWFLAGLLTGKLSFKAKLINFKPALALVATALAFIFLLAALFFTLRLTLAESNYNQALLTANLNEKLFFTEQATRAFPFEYYPTELGYQLMWQIKEGSLKRDSLPLVKSLAEKGLKIAPLEPKNYLTLGLYYLELNSKEAAKQSLNYLLLAIKKEPYNLETMKALSNVYLRLGQKERSAYWHKRANRYSRGS